MCICMLTKRTNILFSQEQWKKIQNLARKQQVSIGSLVRKAIDQMEESDEILKKREEAYDHILKIRKRQKGKIDYKELINYGRKY